MNIRELSKAVSKKTKVPIMVIYPILLAAVEIMRQSVADGDTVKLRNFVSFKIDVVDERTFRMPSGQVISKPRRFKLFIDISSGLKKIINAKKAY